MTSKFPHPHSSNSTRRVNPRYLPVGVHAAVAQHIIEAGVKALAKTWHPDVQGGDAEVMQEIDATAQYLSQNLSALFGAVGGNDR